MKLKLIPFLVLVCLGFTTLCFGQLSCSVASTPVSRAASTGHAEPAGDIFFNCTAGGVASTAASISVLYPATITNDASYPAGKPIAITGQYGGFVGASPVIYSVANNTVTMTIPPQSASGSFQLTGVLVSLANSGLNNVIANISVSPGNGIFIIAGQTSPVVITSVLSGLKSPVLSASTNPAIVFNTGTVSLPSWSVDISENYIDLFRSSAQFNGGTSTNGARLSLTLAGIPTGVTIGGCSVTAVANGTSSGSPFIVGGVSTLTSVANTVSIDWAGSPNLTSIEKLTFSCTGITVGGGASLPLSTGNITLQATLAPTGSALGNGGSVLTSPDTGQIPRYAVALLPANGLTVVSIQPPPPPRAPNPRQITSSEDE
jgi:hypothetical protein